jgi:hypothetical protein
MLRTLKRSPASVQGACTHGRLARAIQAACDHAPQQGSNQLGHKVNDGEELVLVLVEMVLQRSTRHRARITHVSSACSTFSYQAWRSRTTAWPWASGAAMIAAWRSRRQPKRGFSFVTTWRSRATPARSSCARSTHPDLICRRWCRRPLTRISNGRASSWSISSK